MSQWDHIQTFIKADNNFGNYLNVNHFWWELYKFTVILLDRWSDSIEIKTTEIVFNVKKKKKVPVGSGLNNTYKSISKISMIMKAIINFRINKMTTSITSAKNRLYNGAKTYSNPPFWLITEMNFVFLLNQNSA